MTNLRRLLTAASVTVASIGLLVIAGTGTAQAQGSGAGIVGSPHDFSNTATYPWNFRGEICRVCHVPHDHARTTQLYLNGLLWNHQISSEIYSMYDSAWSSSLNNVQSPQPDGTAKLCLGCHDGSVGIDQFDKNAEIVGANFVPSGAEIGFFTDGGNTDLRGTHPLSIAYNGSDLGLNPEDSPMGSSGTIASVLDNGKVQCSTCHDVHDSAGEAVAGTHLLRVLNNGTNPSGLCLTCHNK